MNNILALFTGTFLSARGRRSSIWFAFARCIKRCLVYGVYHIMATLAPTNQFRVVEPNLKIQPSTPHRLVLASNTK